MKRMSNSLFQGNVPIVGERVGYNYVSKLGGNSFYRSSNTKPTPTLRSNFVQPQSLLSDFAFGSLLSALCVPFSSFPSAKIRPYEYDPWRLEPLFT
jgi:hypothetical protein